MREVVATAMQLTCGGREKMDREKNGEAVGDNGGNLACLDR